MCMCVYLNASMFDACMDVPKEAKRRHQIPWNQSYKQLWAIWCVHWELNQGRLQEQQMILTAEPYLHLHTVCLIAHVPKSSLKPDCFIALVPGCVLICVWTKGLLGQASYFHCLKQVRGCQVHKSKRAECITQTKLSPRLLQSSLCLPASPVHHNLLQELLFVFMSLASLQLSIFAALISLKCF